MCVLETWLRADIPLKTVSQLSRSRAAHQSLDISTVHYINSRCCLKHHNSSTRKIIIALTNIFNTSLQQPLLTTFPGFLTDYITVCNDCKVKPKFTTNAHTTFYKITSLCDKFEKCHLIINCTSHII